MTYNIVISERGERKTRIKDAIKNYILDCGYDLLSVSGYYFDVDGRENYIIHFNADNMDAGEFDAGIDKIYATTI